MFPLPFNFATPPSLPTAILDTRHVAESDDEAIEQVQIQLPSLARPDRGGYSKRDRILGPAPKSY